MPLSSDFHTVKVGFNQFTIDKRYTNLVPQGDGSYGFVASAHDNLFKKKVAIKKVKETCSHVLDAKRILRELKLLRHFNYHENIVNIVDIMTDPPDSPHFRDIYIVTNLFESDLERIINSKQPLTDHHYQFFLYQMLRGLKYIHSANVLHRDLKPSNILVNANCDLALCDFGLSRGYNSESDDPLTEYVVTRWYRAPELLCENPYYGKSVDIWSIGCIFAELIIRQPFFRGNSPQHQLQVIIQKLGCPPLSKLDFIHSTVALSHILKFERHQPPSFTSLFPKDTNTLAIDLIRQMLAFHPDDRITVENALQHPYLNDFYGQLPEPLCDSVFDFEYDTNAHKYDFYSDLRPQYAASIMNMKGMNEAMTVVPSSQELSSMNNAANTLIHSVSLDSSMKDIVQPPLQQQISASNLLNLSSKPSLKEDLHDQIYQEVLLYRPQLSPMHTPKRKEKGKGLGGSDMGDDESCCMNIVTPHSYPPLISDKSIPTTTATTTATATTTTSTAAAAAAADSDNDNTMKDQSIELVEDRIVEKEVELNDSKLNIDATHVLVPLSSHNSQSIVNKENSSNTTETKTETETERKEGIEHMSITMSALNSTQNTPWIYPLSSPLSYMNVTLSEEKQEPKDDDHKDDDRKDNHSDEHGCPINVPYVTTTATGTTTATFIAPCRDMIDSDHLLRNSGSGGTMNTCIDGHHCSNQTTVSSTSIHQDPISSTAPITTTTSAPATVTVTDEHVKDEMYTTTVAENSSQSQVPPTPQSYYNSSEYSTIHMSNRSQASIHSNPSTVYSELSKDYDAASSGEGSQPKQYFTTTEFTPSTPSSRFSSSSSSSNGSSCSTDSIHDMYSYRQHQSQVLSSNATNISNLSSTIVTSTATAPLSSDNMKHPSDTHPLFQMTSHNLANTPHSNTNAFHHLSIGHDIPTAIINTTPISTTTAVAAAATTSTTKNTKTSTTNKKKSSTTTTSTAKKGNSTTEKNKTYNVNFNFNTSYGVLGNHYVHDDIRSSTNTSTTNNNTTNNDKKGSINDSFGYNSNIWNYNHLNSFMSNSTNNNTYVPPNYGQFSTVNINNMSVQYPMSGPPTKGSKGSNPTSMQQPMMPDLTSMYMNKVPNPAVRQSTVSSSVSDGLPFYDCNLYGYVPPLLPSYIPVPVVSRSESQDTHSVTDTTIATQPSLATLCYSNVTNPTMNRTTNTTNSVSYDKINAMSSFDPRAHTCINNNNTIYNNNNNPISANQPLYSQSNNIPNHYQNTFNQQMNSNNNNNNNISYMNNFSRPNSNGQNMYEGCGGGFNTQYALPTHHISYEHKANITNNNIIIPINVTIPIMNHDTHHYNNTNSYPQNGVTGVGSGTGTETTYHSQILSNTLRKHLRSSPNDYRTMYANTKKFASHVDVPTSTYSSPPLSSGGISNVQELQEGSYMNNPSSTQYSTHNHNGDNNVLKSAYNSQMRTNTTTTTTNNAITNNVINSGGSTYNTHHMSQMQLPNKAKRMSSTSSTDQLLDDDFYRFAYELTLSSASVSHSPNIHPIEVKMSNITNTTNTNTNNTSANAPAMYRSNMNNNNTNTNTNNNSNNNNNNIEYQNNIYINMNAHPVSRDNISSSTGNMNPHTYNTITNTNNMNSSFSHCM